MEHKFYINSKNGYAAMLEQYRAMHKQIGEARFLPNRDMYIYHTYTISNM